MRPVLSGWLNAPGLSGGVLELAGAMRPVLSGWVNAPPFLSSWLAQCSEMSGAMRPVLSGWLNAPGLSGGVLEWLEQCAQFSVAGSNPVNALGLSEGSEAVNGSSPV